MTFEQLEYDIRGVVIEISPERFSFCTAFVTTCGEAF